VPLAIVSLVGYCLGGVFGIGYLAHRQAVWDMRSYCRDPHVVDLLRRPASFAARSGPGLMGPLVGVVGATLVSYLIVILLFCTYQPLRFSDRGSGTAGALRGRVCGCLRRVRAGQLHRCAALGRIRASARTHLEGGNLPGSMKARLLHSLLAFALLFATLMKYEMWPAATYGPAVCSAVRGLRRTAHHDGAAVLQAVARVVAEQPAPQTPGLDRVLLGQHLIFHQRREQQREASSDV